MAISEQRQQRMDQKANQIMAVVLPLLEFGGIGYVTWVVVYLICTQYLMHPPDDAAIPTRRPTGTALIVVYCVLLVPFLVSFLRMLQVIWTDPGLVPLGDKEAQEKGAAGASTRYFDRLDAYICDYNGDPLWCQHCKNYKPDRAHHSSQMGRCVRRMDHFCPYAGGIIGETTHKFFVQFLFYGSLYTGFSLIVTAVFFAERMREVRLGIDLTVIVLMWIQLNSRPGTWIAALAVAAFCFAFIFGMFMNTFYNMAINCTTIEVMQKGCSYNIAMLGKAPPVPVNGSSQTGVLCEIERSPSRSYIVLQTHSGENPWDEGFSRNVTDIMGHTIWEWLLPVKWSPCTVHTDTRGEYRWGRVVKTMMEEYGAGSVYARSARSSRSKHRRASRTDSYPQASRHKTPRDVSMPEVLRDEPMMQDHPPRRHSSRRS